MTFHERQQLEGGSADENVSMQVVCVCVKPFSLECFPITPIAP